jgi:hypothetical protein
LKLKSNRLDLLQKDYIQLNFLKHSMNNLLTTWDCHPSYIPRKKGELHSKKRGFPRVLNLLLNAIFPKEEAPLFRERETTSLKDFTHGVGLTALPGLSKQVGDEAPFLLVGLYLPTIINIHTLRLITSPC